MKNLISCFLLIFLLSCQQKQEPAFDTNLLIGTWKKDSGQTIAEDIIIADSDLPFNDKYDTTEYWKFLSFRSENDVYEIYFPGNNSHLSHYEVTDSTLTLKSVDFEDFHIIDQYDVRTIDSKRLILTSSNSSFMSVDFYSRVDSLEATSQFYEQKMHDQYLQRQAVRDLLLGDEALPISATKPVFSLGEAKLYEMIGENIVYPDAARRLNIEGRVLLSFVVEKDGSISNLTVLKAPHELLADAAMEALRKINEEPRWNPGKVDGRPARVRISLPVVFKLN